MFLNYHQITKEEWRHWLVLMYFVMLMLPFSGVLIAYYYPEYAPSLALRIAVSVIAAILLALAAQPTNKLVRQWVVVISVMVNGIIVYDLQNNGFGVPFKIEVLGVMILFNTLFRQRRNLFVYLSLYCGTIVFMGLPVAMAGHSQLYPFLGGVCLAALLMYFSNAWLLQSYHKLQENEMMLREAERIAHFGYWQADLALKKVKFSEEAFRIWGYKITNTDKQYPEYLNLEEFLPRMAQQQTLIDAFRTEIIEKKSVFNQNVTITDFQNQTKYLQVIGKPLLDGQNKLVGVYGIIHDITQAVINFDELQTSKTYFENIINSSEQAIILVSLDNIVLTFNKKALKLIPRLATGIDMEAFSMEDLGFTCNELMQNLKKAKQGERIEIERQNPTTNTWKRFTYTPITNEQNAMFGVTIGVTDITMFKQNEEAVRDAEGVYRKILNAVQDQVMVMNQNAELIWANDSFNNFHTEQYLQQIIDKQEDNSQIDRVMLRSNQDLLKAGETFTMTLTEQNRHGQDFIFKVMHLPLLDRHHKLTHIIRIAQDMTEAFRKEAELKSLLAESQKVYQELMQSKIEAAENAAKLQILADNSAELITLCSPEGSIEYVSPSCKKLLGFTREQLTGKNFIDLFYPDDITMVQEESQQQVSKNMVEIKLTHRLETKEGSYIWVDSIIKYLKDDQKNVINLQTSSRDCTERIESENALKNSERKFKRLFNSGYDAIFIFGITPEGLYEKFKEVNDVACHILGYSRPELSQMTMFDLEPNLSPKAATERNNHLITAPNTIWQIQLQTKQGLRLPFEIVQGFIQIEGKMFVQAICRDISEKLRIAQAEKERELAERSLKFKSEFLANMSHEIRTPMNGIVGMSHLLMRTNLTPRQIEYVQTIQGSSKNLLAILNDILDLSKLEVGKMQLKPRVFDLFKSVNTIQGLFASLFMQKKLSFEILYDEQALPQFIVADETRLNQVLTNLMSNAVKFTHRGGISLGVTLELIDPQQRYWLKFTLKDTGIGIRPENVQKLFEKFYQIDSELTNKQDGTGLGLSICKQLVELWQGNIGVTSRVGVGSTFWFTIPVSKPNDEQLIQKDKEIFEEEMYFERLHILVVEDKVVNQEVVKLTLQNAGCKVTLAANGQEALNALEKNNYELVIMDIQMPVMDGITATKKIKETHLKPPIIIGLSANAMEGDAEKFISEGMDDYLSKPIDPPLMFNKIAKWFPHHVSSKERIEKQRQEQKQTQQTSNQSAPMPTPTINKTVIDKILQLAKGNKAYINTIFESFHNDMENLLGSSAEAIQQQDYQTLTKNIHTMKGLCGTIGASQLHQLTSVFYAQLKANQYDQLNEHLARLEQAYQDLKIDMEKL